MRKINKIIIHTVLFPLYLALLTFGIIFLVFAICFLPMWMGIV